MVVRSRFPRSPRRVPWSGCGDPKIAGEPDHPRAQRGTFRVWALACAALLFGCDDEPPDQAARTVRSAPVEFASTLDAGAPSSALASALVLDAGDVPTDVVDQLETDAGLRDGGVLGDGGTPGDGGAADGGAQTAEALRDMVEAAFARGEALDTLGPYEITGECEDVYVYIVTLSVDDPMQSTVSLALGEDGTAGFRRVGGRIGHYEVMAIRDDWTGLQPTVWLRDGVQLCHAALSGNVERAKQARKRAAALRKKEAARRRAAAKKAKAKAKKRKRNRRKRRKRR